MNRVSFSFASSPVMAPFCHLLSSKVPFHWSPELQAVFDTSKEEIIAQCQACVWSFLLHAPTALATDWSQTAMGFWLTQKVCSCEGDPKPCWSPSGWQTIYVGSRFCTPAEPRYHPIEGEACASAWALDKCRALFLYIHSCFLLGTTSPSSLSWALIRTSVLFPT